MREVTGDGNYGGACEKPDAQTLEIWCVAIEETREVHPHHVRIGGRGHGTRDCSDW
jgi:hypothetical protein